MANKLTTFLTKAALNRTVADCEAVYDDFVHFAGGVRISERFSIPPGRLNADYYFDLELFEILLELKQLSTYRAANTIDQYFSERFSEGKLRQFERLSNEQIRITPDSLSTKDWNQFYKRFRPAISTDLKRAARQLKATDGFLPAPAKRRLKGVMFVNSGDFNLSTDLLARLVEWRVKREWKSGYFRSIDFVSCVTIDMIRDQQHPLYGRHIARTIEDDLLVTAVHYLYNRWIHYGAAAVGAEVEFRRDAPVEEPRADLSSPFRGKIVLVQNASETD